MRLEEGTYQFDLETSLRNANEVTRTALDVLDLKRGHSSLEGLIYQYYKDDFISQVVLQHPKLEHRTSELQQSMQAYERGFEKQFAQEFLENDAKTVEKYIEHYRGMVRREGKMAQIKPYDKILVLGGGSIPLSAITFSRVFDACITCIDIDRQAVKISSQLVKRLGLQKNIDIQYGDGNRYPMNGYDMILITCSMPKSKILLSHIFNEINTATKVIYRDPLGLYKLWYRETDSKDIAGYTILRCEESNKQWAAKSTLIAKM